MGTKTGGGARAERLGGWFAARARGPRSGGHLEPRGGPRALSMLGLALAVACVSSGTAHAAPPDDPRERAAASWVGVDVTVATSHDSASHSVGVAPIILGRARLDRSQGLYAAVPLAFGRLDVTGEGSFDHTDLANPELGYERIFRNSPTSQQVLRLSVVLPALQPQRAERGDILSANANNLAAMGRGLTDRWRWLAETFSVVLTAEARIDLGPLYFEGIGTLAVLVPTSGDDGDATRLDLAGTARLAYRTPLLWPYVALSTDIDLGGKEAPNAFRLGAQAGLLGELGPVEVDVGVQFNLVGTGAGSFDPDGVFGVRTKVKVAF